MAADDAGTVLLDVPGNPTMRILRTGRGVQNALTSATARIG